MRYWAYINNQVCGPVEKEKLPELATFTLATLVCPEAPAGGEAVAWKAASAYPEVLAALTPAPSPAPAPAPAPQRAPAAESPLMMTMRGTIIDMPVVQPAAAPQPAPAPAPAAESPLMMTMRGTLIEAPAIKEPALAAPAPAAQQTAPQPEPAAQKLEQISAMLASIANGQSQLLERLGRVESSVAEMKALLFPGK